MPALSTLLSLLQLKFPGLIGESLDSKACGTPGFFLSRVPGWAILEGGVSVLGRWPQTRQVWVPP